MTKFKILRDDDYIAIYENDVLVADVECCELDLIFKAFGINFTEYESDIDWLEHVGYEYPKNFSEVVTV